MELKNMNIEIIQEIKSTHAKKANKSKHRHKSLKQYNNHTNQNNKKINITIKRKIKLK